MHMTCYHVVFAYVEFANTQDLIVTLFLRLQNSIEHLSRKHLAEALIISKIGNGNIIYSNALQNSLLRLQKLLKVTCSFVNGRCSNSLDVILLGWLPISERIDFCIMKLAHKDLYVTSFLSYVKLSFKKLS